MSFPLAMHHVVVFTMCQQILDIRNRVVNNSFLFSKMRSHTFPFPPWLVEKSQLLVVEVDQTDIKRQGEDYYYLH